MAGGRSPIKQLNALPLLTAAQWVGLGVGNPGSSFMVGNHLIKYWDPNATGIHGTAGNQQDPNFDPLHQVYAITDWIDLTGVRDLTLNLVCKIKTVAGPPWGDQDQTWNVLMIPYAKADAGAVDPLPDLPGPNVINLVGKYTVTNPYPFVCMLATRGFIGFINGTFYKSAAGAFGFGRTSNDFTQTGAPGVCKFYLFSNTGADPVGLYLSIWGQG